MKVKPGAHVNPDRIERSFPKALTCCKSWQSLWEWLQIKGSKDRLKSRSMSADGCCLFPRLQALAGWCHHGIRGESRALQGENGAVGDGIAPSA